LTRIRSNNGEFVLIGADYATASATPSRLDRRQNRASWTLTLMLCAGYGGQRREPNM
jgi:hypothetical protein